MPRCKTEASTKIWQYNVELETWQEGSEQRSDCFVYHEKTGTSASLQCLQDTGMLENYSGGGERHHTVEAAIIDEIEKWATERGY